MNDWEELARKGALEAFMEGDEERALDLLAAARAIAGEGTYLHKEHQGENAA